MRILFLDDDQERHDLMEEAVRHLRPDAFLQHVYTAKEAIQRLHGGPWDLVCLDRDLDLIDDDAETGEIVAEFLALHVEREKYPKLVWVHSWNNGAARFMTKVLEAAGHNVLRATFSYLTTRAQVRRVLGQVS